MNTVQRSEQQRQRPSVRTLLSLREAVLREWAQTFREQVAAGGDLPPPLLMASMPACFDQLAGIVDQGAAPSFDTPDAAAAHGQARAATTSLRADQVVHEFQLLRDAVLTVAQRAGLRLSDADMQRIESCADQASRAALREFTAAHDAARDRAAASLSHDMATPLSLITARAQMIKATGSLDTAHRTAGKIEAGARRLACMVTELVDTFAGQSATGAALQLSCFDMRDLVDAVCQEFKLRACVRADTGPDPAPGYWCAPALQRALENLVTNALKYGDGGVVTVSTRPGTERLLLGVHNLGNPIAPDDQQRLFAYRRRHTDDDAVPGWGIGLAFVRQVAEAHGGSVMVDSAPARGTTFTLDLPTDCRPFILNTGAAV
jgi:signal transduction histidine kinase